MIQLFETSTIDGNCDIGPNDMPFTMPLMPADHIFLRLQVPYYLVDLNGGGLPVGANVAVSIYNIAGDSQLCGLGSPAAGKYLYNFVNDGTNRIGAYRFMIPIRLPYDYITQQWPVNVGDKVLVIINLTEIYSFVYGVDPTPYPIIEFKPGVLCIRRDYALSMDVNINGASIVPTDTFVDDEISCWTDTCFRVRIAITFSFGTYYFFTKQFQMVNCDEETLFLQSQYGTNMIDCAGQVYNGSYAALGSNELYLRIPADLERAPSKLSRVINEKCFLYRSEITKQVRMRSIPLPDWFQDAVETLLLGKTLTVDGEPYQIDSESIFEINDNPGTTFQNINVFLQSCKCDNVFVC